MKQLPAVLALFALALASPVFADDAPAPAKQTLTGEYVWAVQDRPTEIEAHFTPTGENAWNVEFHFTFSGKARTYTGTATGNLVDGSLEGEVRNEDKKRTFTFAGAFGEDGTFDGTHAETTHGEPQPTGTITLKR